MKKIILIVSLALALLAGCGAPNPKVSGNFSMTIKDYQQAVEFYEKALQDDPDSVLLLTKLGRAYYNLGEYDKAEKNFKGAVEVQSDYPNATFYLGLCAIMKGDREAAFEIFDNFRYLGEPEVTRSVTTMAHHLADNTDDPDEYIAKKMIQSWDDGLKAAQQAETGKN